MDVENFVVDEEALPSQVREAVGAAPYLSEEDKHLLIIFLSMTRHGNMTKEAATISLRQTMGDEVVDAIDRVLAYQKWVMLVNHIQVGGGAIQSEHAPTWYVEQMPGDIFWPALKNKLINDPKWQDVVPSLDKSSKIVVSHLGNPSEEVMKTRGLVVGYVQSGKTANYSATIAKAADRGYRIFIILSGMYNNLRDQTQARMQSDLIDLAHDRWVPLTQDEDFRLNAIPVHLLADRTNVFIGVIKKNSSRLEALNKWLNKAQGLRDDGTPIFGAPDYLQDSPILIIDDECDQASPNAAKKEAESRTKINEHITKLLTGRRVTYVGYTASPFASLVIDPTDEYDIYPRDFIVPLPKPEGYFGISELFGVNEDSSAESPELIEQPAYEVLHELDEEEAKKYKENRENWEAKVTDPLNVAIRWFVLATSARRVRSGGKKQHSSMLMHTTHRVFAQAEYYRVLTDFAEELKSGLDGDYEKYEEIWRSESVKVPAASFGLEELSFEEIWSYVPEVVEDLSVTLENGQSLERLDYQDDDPKTVIVVGGNTLARGLTLEGLVCSFFLRTSRQYDSLLQMGRWFGYRPQYADLTRIWIDKDYAEYFAWLGYVEDHIRKQLEEGMNDPLVTPLNVPKQILTHEVIQVTARNKLNFIVTANPVSFGGKRIQTTFFSHNDDYVTGNNLAVLRSSIPDFGNPHEHQDGVLYKDVSASKIIEFFESYNFHDDGAIRSDDLREYINLQNSFERIRSWNVLIGQPRNRAGRPTVSLGDDPLLENVTTINRTRLISRSNDEVAALGVIQEKRHFIADCEISGDTTPNLTEDYLKAERNRNGNALLVIYVINKDSTPKPPAPRVVPVVPVREGLQSVNHLVGLMMSFPDVHPRSARPDGIVLDPELLPDLILGDAADLEEEEILDRDSESILGEDGDGGT